MSRCNYRLFLVVASLGVPLTGCASIVKGSSEEIQVNTNPAGASCAFVRDDEAIGTISPTPGSLTIEKTKYDITIRCGKPGYDEVSYTDKSGVEGWTFGNFGFGGLMGWGIDSATGADNHYETPVNITLQPKP